jgi:phospholipid transport system transporter-binding protein
MKVDAGNITNANAAELLEAGQAAIRGGDLAFDLGAVRQVDSAAVALLLAWQREAVAAKGRIVLANVPAPLASLATLYGVDGLLGCAHLDAAHDTQAHHGPG